MATKPGSIVHVELHSADPVKSKAFYGEVFGWKFKEFPEMNYIMWTAPNEPAGGLMKALEGRPPQVLNYILSKEIDETSRKIATAGGVIIQPKMEIPGQGWWALFQEPGGTMMALYQGMAQQRRAARPKPAAKKAKARKRK